LEHDVESGNFFQITIFTSKKFSNQKPPKALNFCIFKQNFPTGENSPKEKTLTANPEHGRDYPLHGPLFESHFGGKAPLKPIRLWMITTSATTQNWEKTACRCMDNDHLCLLSN